MLNNRVTNPGTLLFLEGRVYLDGWELAEPGMCREHAIFACLYVAAILQSAAQQIIAEGGSARHVISDMPRETPKEWLCASTRAFDDMFDDEPAPETTVAPQIPEAPEKLWECSICGQSNYVTVTHCERCDYSRSIMRNGRLVPRDGQR